MFIYNFSLLILFWILKLIINTNFKTIFAFADLKFNTFFTLLITIILFSAAGVPPFIGFFSKLLILITLLNSNFFFFYTLFFILLFFGLYFYLQNIRFLYSTSSSKLSYSFDFNLRLPYGFLAIASIFCLFLIFGFFFFDDLILYFYWLLY